MRNLGPGGALVESVVPLPSGSRLTGRLSLDGHVREIKAEVRHVQEESKTPGDARFLVGVQWVDATRPIDDLLAAASTAARSVPRELERRHSPRMHASDGTEINRAVWQTVKVLDVSVSGVLFLAPQWMGVGEKGQLRLRLGDSSFVADIEVRRSDRHQAISGGYRIGAAFTALADGSKASLEEFIGAAER